MARLDRIGVYDCLHVALAEREGCDLVTADDRLAVTSADLSLHLAAGVVALNLSDNKPRYRNPRI
jgi:predicted nucleic acid-binding protein